MNADNIKQNLKYIKTMIENGSLKENRVIIHVMIAETIQGLKNTAFLFKVKYTGAGNKMHYQSYEKRAKKYRSKLLVDMEELERKLNKKPVNEKACKKLIQKMLDTDLYTSYTQAVINQWQPKTKHYKTEAISI
ncbi:hypothetical protein COL23_11450 [Priestia aryabhattai]|uniref:hypothetical protein n=1 Tax=Priestia aryabhattai TaxID=412384 RepID=UPI000BF74D6E|nr:hypothetical protein [Priestia aryabhattai]PFW76577.1 hypothetical protein COL23_11450 [Priestia aryabhattai]